MGMASSVIAIQMATCHGHQSGARRKAMRIPGKVPVVPEAKGLSPVPKPLANSVIIFFIRRGSGFRVQSSRLKEATLLPIRVISAIRG
jgi:hypothetical protein